MLECIRALIDIDREWVPDQSDASLYIRPCLIGTEETLGPKPPTKAKCFVIMFPIGTSHSEPISLLADPSVVQAELAATNSAQITGLLFTRKWRLVSSKTIIIIS